MTINEILKYYFTVIVSTFPIIFYFLTIYTCDDLFWTSIIMVMVYYLILTIYYFKYENQLLNNLIINNLEYFLNMTCKQKYLIKGVMIGCGEFLCFVLIAKPSGKPLELPLPCDIQSFSRFIYFILVILFYCIGFEFFSEIFFNLFIKYIMGRKYTLVLVGVFSLIQIGYFTNNIISLIVLLGYSVVNEYFKNKFIFGINALNRVGNKIGYVITGYLLLVISNYSYKIIAESPNNYWKP